MWLCRAVGDRQIRMPITSVFQPELCLEKPFSLGVHAGHRHRGRYHGEDNTWLRLQGVRSDRGGRARTRFDWFGRDLASSSSGSADLDNDQFVSIREIHLLYSIPWLRVAAIGSGTCDQRLAIETRNDQN